MRVYVDPACPLGVSFGGDSNKVSVLGEVYRGSCEEGSENRFSAPFAEAFRHEVRILYPSL